MIAHPLIAIVVGVSVGIVLRMLWVLGSEKRRNPSVVWFE